MAAKPAVLFEKMKESLDLLAGTYKRSVPRNQPEKDYPPVRSDEPYLKTHLKHMLAGRKPVSIKRRSSGDHVLIVRKQEGDYRVALPKIVHASLKEQAEQNEGRDLWCAANATATWLACYLNGIYPDKAQEGWEAFECSHRCCFNRQGAAADGRMCIDKECLVWESKSSNQSRGNDFCTQKCKHEACGRTVCECQGLHSPPCV